MQHSDGKWHSSANELLCFLFNGVKGCSKNPCLFAHKCSIYGDGSAGHNAQLHVPPLDLLPIVTPLLWDKWEELLDAVGVLDVFWDVPLGLCNGFCLGVSSSISSTFSPPNNSSALEHAEG